MAVSPQSDLNSISQQERMLQKGPKTQHKSKIGRGTFLAAQGEVMPVSFDRSVS